MICQPYNPGNTYINWGRTDCEGDTVEYWGYVMSSHRGHERQKYECVDEAREVHELNPGRTNNNGYLWYYTEYEPQLPDRYTPYSEVVCGTLFVFCLRRTSKIVTPKKF